MNKAVSKAETNGVPAHILSGGNKGKDLDPSMVTIPRVKLLQSLSKEADRTSDSKIDGAEAGHIMLTSGNDLYDELFVLNLGVRAGYIAFSEATKSPFRAMVTGADGEDGLFSTKEAVLSALDFAEVPEQKIASEIGQKAPKDGYTVMESHRHHILVLDPETETIKTPANMDFIKTKVAISKQWNTTIAAQQGDRFASVYRIGSKVQSWDDKSWFNYDISWHGYASKALYEEAEKIFDSM